MNFRRDNCFIRLALFLSFCLVIEGASYTNLRKRGQTDPNCKCTPWDYVNQCGENCRQFRWRDCEPSACAVEDESVPCYTVEWGEWGECDAATCTRTRTELCMCLTRIVSPDICDMEMATETQNCETDIETGEWSSCDETCWRERSRTCKCVNPSTGTRTTVLNGICGLPLTGDNERRSCLTREEYSAWTECDEECRQERSGKCMCDDTVTSFEVIPALCNMAEEHKDKRNCASEWGDWIHHEECPATLPVGDCTPNVKRVRFCYCINPGDQSKFSVDDFKCGLEPSKASFLCNVPEKCSCGVMGGTPAICHTTCNEKDEGWAVGGDPTCSCAPWWYEGRCDPDQMTPDRKYCHVEPSKWSEWGPWAPENCDGNCQQKRSRRCACFDGRQLHESDISKCVDGDAEETRDCETEWGKWYKKPCPSQQVGQCHPKTAEYRQCECKPRPGIKMSNDQCEGDLYFRVVSCPGPPCKCDWRGYVVADCDKRTCTAYGNEIIPPECVCTPDWYKGKCDLLTQPTRPDGPDICPPTIPFEWESWSAFSTCDTLTTCQKTRIRQCSCKDQVLAEPVYDDKCGDDSVQSVSCDRVWGPWEGGCSEALCTTSTATKTRKCYCKFSSTISWGSDEEGNHDAAAAERECGYLGGISTEVEVCDVKNFEVSDWSAWSDCDTDCVRSKSRDCQCVDSNDVYNDARQCPADTEYSSTANCDAEWSEWSVPDCGEKSCILKTRPRFRNCMCKDPVCKVSRDKCPAAKFEMAVKCPQYAQDEPVCQGCSCSDWVCSPRCDNSYVRTCGPAPGCDTEIKFGSKSCCGEEECTCSEWRCKASCDKTMIRDCTHDCDIEEKAILEPCCVTSCKCTPWQCKESCDDSMIRECENQCDIEEKEILEPCCEKPCQCTDWKCKESCDASMIRECVNQCDIEEKAILEPCCEKPCQCTDWKCKESCDASMIRECVNQCDIEEKAILEPCCEKPCQCTDWECKESCDASMIRECENQCDIEEKAILEPCCEKPCQCTSWRCKDVCDATMIRECQDGCDEEEKPILELCCSGGGDGSEGGECSCNPWECTADCFGMRRTCDPPQCETEQKTIEESCCESCECSDWVAVACHVEEDGVCVQEEWRGCSPEFCDEQVRRIPGSECCESAGGNIPDDCSDCGRWISVGKCRVKESFGDVKEGDIGNYDWRSVESCDKIKCEEFRCHPDSKQCKEEICGEWYDIGECVEGDGSGVHQWRSADECHCEPYRCNIEVEGNHNEDGNEEEEEDHTGPASLLATAICTCTPWHDMTGCDAQCVNTESRACTPKACEEEYRIQSGFCCK